METIEGFDFFPLQFDAAGTLQGTLDELKQRTGAATDIIFLAHGFRNSADDATKLYTKFLNNFRTHLNRPELGSLPARNYAVAGVFWPSLAFRETFPSQDGGVQDFDPAAAELAPVRQQLLELKAEAGPEAAAKLDEAQALLPMLNNSTEAQDQFVALVMSVLDGTKLGNEEGVERVSSQDGSVILSKLRPPILVSTQNIAAESDGEGSVANVGSNDFGIPVSPADAEGGAQGLGSFFGSIAGAVGRFLNFTTWGVMKTRSGTVGANGVAKAVRDLKASKEDVKIHLVGHSLGGRLMASCSKALGDAPKLQPDSVTLLEAAFSHYGFSPNAGENKPGFFREVIEGSVSKGPLIATFSALDTVVGHVYALASRVADDNVKALGDANDPFGGIGRNGAQKTPESVVDALHDAGSPYTFVLGKVNNLDGSAHLILDHGDVTNERVTYAFASAVNVT